MRKWNAAICLIAMSAWAASAAEWSAPKTIQSFKVVGLYDLQITCTSDESVYYMDQASTVLSEKDFHGLARQTLCLLTQAQNRGDSILLSLTGNQSNGTVLINAVKLVQP